MNLQIDNPARLILTIVGIIALTVLMLTHTIDHEDGMVPLLYLIGYTVGGTFGPKISKVTSSTEDKVLDLE